jgi:hypothetical protein
MTQYMHDFMIKDWAGNLCFEKSFPDFEEAEDYLAEYLGDDYDTDRQKYCIFDRTKDGV